MNMSATAAAAAAAAAEPQDNSDLFHSVLEGVLGGVLINYLNPPEIGCLAMSCRGAREAIRTQEIWKRVAQRLGLGGEASASAAAVDYRLVVGSFYVDFRERMREVLFCSTPMPEGQILLTAEKVQELLRARGILLVWSTHLDNTGNCLPSNYEEAISEASALESESTMTWDSSQSGWEDPFPQEMEDVFGERGAFLIAEDGQSPDQIISLKQAGQLLGAGQCVSLMEKIKQILGIDLEPRFFASRRALLIAEEEVEASLAGMLPQLQTLTNINLEDTSLCTVPDFLQNLVQLVDLKLRGNHLKALPLWLPQLVALEELDISSNNFDCFPRCIRGMNNLKSLNISGNRIKKLPGWIVELDQLTTFDVSQNWIVEVSPQIGGWMAKKGFRLGGQFRVPVVPQKEIEDGAAAGAAAPPRKRGRTDE